MGTQATSQNLRQVITASSLGTLIEWYDFYIFGSLAVLMGKHLFPTGAGASALINTLAIFAAGFIVRPFGALVFGRLGDLVGRKYTFLLTLVLMGGSTFAIGIIPGYETIGYAAPVLVLIMRLIQGLALGGEYGGAATYVSEHAPAHRRGFFTSWIQTTATLGLFLSLGVILLTKSLLGDEAFSDWGWRVPFLVSVLLVLVSIYIRMKMSESPAFTKLKQEGKVSASPLKDSFSKRSNFKMVLLALFGAVMGQGVVWYTGQFYAQTFIETVCKVNFEQTRTILLWAILCATPFFIVFGSLSDKIGRKWIMMGGMFLAVISYRPIYSFFLNATGENALTEIVSPPTVTRTASFNKATGDSVITVTTHTIYASGIEVKQVSKEFVAVTSSHTPQKPEILISKTLPAGTYALFILLVFVQIIFVTMVYGPIAAFLVELFPVQIRYSSMSLPYHIGNGVFGGLVPFLSTLIVSFTKTPENPNGSPLAGLWYPIGVAALCLLIGIVFLDNKKRNHSL
ncbi:MAG: MHS family MFS transporter [Bacteroidetes bacterium]|nr:MHS family MFS transporter [Bacteroidota bacterium]